MDHAPKFEHLAEGIRSRHPGTPSALNRVECVDVRLPDGTEGIIPRPTLQGALITKAYAYTVPLDLARDRHLIDLTVLSTLVSAADDIAVGLTRSERSKIGNALVNARLSLLARQKQFADFPTLHRLPQFSCTPGGRPGKGSRYMVGP